MIKCKQIGSLMTKIIVENKYCGRKRTINYFQIIGILILLTTYYLWRWRLDSFLCRSSDILAPLNRIDITDCVKSEVTRVIIPILILFGLAFLLCGIIEHFKEKKKKQK